MEELFLVKLLCAVAVLSSIIYQVDCFSSGAPGAACSSLSPDPTSHGAPPNSNSVPYNIDVSAFDVGGSLFYEPGNTYQITLRGNSGEMFRGFLIQGRQRADDTTVLGSFTQISAATTRLGSCSPSAGSVTHNSASFKTSETFTWTAPAAGSGSIWFGFAVVQVRVDYWANQRTAVIEEQVQVIDCGALPNPTNGQVVLPSTVLGSTATYSCNTGFDLVGASTRICQADSTWSEAEPSCQIVDCGALPNPINGQVVLFSTVLGSTATYSCNTGFDLVGFATRFCQADSTWSGAEPSCQIIDCGVLPNPTNGQVVLPSTVLGSTATYSCNTGFDLVGASTRICQADSTWSGAEPSCQIVDCGALPNPANGQVVLFSTVLGSIATYSCNTGFDLIGFTTRFCQADSTWSGAEPSCQILEIAVELSSSVYFSEEGDSFVTITITKSAVTAMDIDVIILLRDESALGGLDYGPFPDAEVSITHTLAATSTESQFGIQIREDSIVEETESFSVELMLPSASQPDIVIGTINRATVFIEDNDRRIGLGDDPHYSILLPSGQLLCYSVQGEHNFTFNLISNSILQMNALFVPDKVREEVTWIGGLGLVVKHSAYKDSTVTRMRFALEGKMLYIGDKVKLSVKNVERISLSGGKLTVSEADSDVQVPEVKVELKDVGLSFFVRYMSNHLDMIWDSVATQPKDSHGMIGQFFRPGVDIDEVRRMLVLPTLDPVPVMRRPVWAFMEREEKDDQLCWTAMNPGYQGKGLLEGHYFDYLVDDVLSSEFKFAP